MIPEEFKLLIAAVTIILFELALYLLQKMVYAAAEEKRIDKSWCINHAHGLICLEEHIQEHQSKSDPNQKTGFYPKEESTSEDKDIDGPNSPDLVD